MVLFTHRLAAPTSPGSQLVTSSSFHCWLELRPELQTHIIHYFSLNKIVNGFISSYNYYFQDHYLRDEYSQGPYPTSFSSHVIFSLHLLSWTPPSPSLHSSALFWRFYFSFPSLWHFSLRVSHPGAQRQGECSAAFIKCIFKRTIS